MRTIFRSAALIALLAVALLSHHTWACTCTSQSVKDAKKSADVVFAGTVDEVTLVDPQYDWEPRVIVRFSVGRVWKGPVSQSFTMYTNIESSSCEGFSRKVLEPGKTLLVYAHGRSAAEWKRNGVPGALDARTVAVRTAGSTPTRPDLINAVPDQATLYSTSICSRSTPIEYAVEDFGELGKPQEVGPLRALPDPTRLPELGLSSNGLPGECAELGDAKRWRKLPRPPVNQAELIELMESALYKEIPNPRPASYWDYWVISTAGKYGLCRTATNPDVICGEAELEFTRDARSTGQWKLEGRVAMHCD